MQSTLSRFEDIHTIVLCSVIVAPSSLRGDFVLKSKRHSLRTLSSEKYLLEFGKILKVRYRREAEKLSWLAMDI